MLRRAREGWYKIIYVAPERLEMPASSGLHRSGRSAW